MSENNNRTVEYDIPQHVLLNLLGLHATTEIVCIVPNIQRFHRGMMLRKKYVRVVVGRKRTERDTEPIRAVGRGQVL